jgi:hypothetical protein
MNYDPNPLLYDAKLKLKEMEKMKGLIECKGIGENINIMPTVPVVVIPNKNIQSPITPTILGKDVGITTIGESKLNNNCECCCYRINCEYINDWKKGHCNFKPPMCQLSTILIGLIICLLIYIFSLYLHDIS